MTITPYVNMSGNAEEAMNYYKSIFGGTIEILRWSNLPPNANMSVNDAWKNKVLHGSLVIEDNVTIYFSDSLMDGDGPINNSVYLHIEFDSEEELRNAFDKLSQGGKINMPVDTMFWGAVYGDLADKFGVNWGCHHQLSE